MKIDDFVAQMMDFCSEMMILMETGSGSPFPGTAAAIELARARRSNGTLHAAPTVGEVRGVGGAALSVAIFQGER